MHGSADILIAVLEQVRAVLRPFKSSELLLLADLC